jgi:hypothetical protein
MSAQGCRICGHDPCPDDCEEVRAIYNERQREITRDLAPEPGCCAGCGGRLLEADLLSGVCSPCSEQWAWEDLANDPEWADRLYGKS